MDADGNPTAGGYSQGFTVSENFACRIPDEIPFEAAAPLLCAGITTYSPLKRFGAGPGKKVAIVGMGGLGHMAVQIAAAMGAEVSVISHGRSKEEDARRFGATHFYATSEEGTVESLASSFDLIICTVSAANLDYAGLIATLRPLGSFVNVGLPETPLTLPWRSVIGGNRIWFQHWWHPRNAGNVGLLWRAWNRPAGSDHQWRRHHRSLQQRCRL